MKKGLIVVAVLSVILAGGYIGLKLYAADQAKQKVDAAIAKTSDVVNVEYENVSVDLVGMDVRISDILVKPVNEKDSLKINEVIIHDFDEKSEIPQFLSVSVNGIEMDISEFGEDAEKFKAFGYTDRILMNFSADYRINPEKKEVNIETVRLGADDVGEILLSLHVSNLDINPNELFGLLFTFPQIVVHKAEIVYKDDSLTERLLKFAAEQENMEVKELKALIFNEMEDEISREKNEMIRKMLTEVRNFIDDPDELSFSLVSKPTQVGQLMAEFEQSMNTYGNFFKQMDSRNNGSKQREAKQGLGRIAKFQEAYLVKHDTYSDRLSEIGFITNSKYYDFYMASADQNAYLAVAKSKAPGTFGRGAGDDVWTIDQRLKLKPVPSAPPIAVPAPEKSAGAVPVKINPPSDPSAKQFEARHGLGQISKNQEAYFSEYDTYTNKLSDIGFKNKSEYYDFYMASADTNTYLAVAKSKAPGISGKGAGDDVWTINQNLKLEKVPKAPEIEKVMEKADENASPPIVQVSEIDLPSVFRRLETAGFSPGPFQKEDLNGLSEAVRKFQRFAKMEETGVIDAATWAKLKILYDPEGSASKGTK